MSDIKKLYVLLTQCVDVFCADLRTTAIISLYINWLVFITETQCLLVGTDWVCVYIVDINPSKPNDYFMYHQ